MKKIDVIISSVIMIGAFLWMMMSAIRLGDTGAIGIFIFLALVALVPLIGMFALMISFIRVFVFGGSDDWKMFSDEDDAQEQEDEKDEDEEREEENETSTYYLNENDKRFFTNNWINGKRMSQAKYLFVTNNFSSNLIDNFFSYEDEEGIEGILEILYRYGVKDIAKMSMSQYRYQGKENQEIDCVVFIHTGGNSEDISNAISYIKTHEFKTKTIVLILNNSNKVKRTMEKVGADSILIYDAQVKNKNYLSDITTWFADIVDKEHPHIYSKEQRSNPLKKTFRCELCGGIRWKKEDDGYVCKDCNCFYSPKEMKKLLLTDRVDDENINSADEQPENLPFDLIHLPELIFPTKTSFCENFPDKTAKQNIRLKNNLTGGLTQNLSAECWIVDDYLIQFVMNVEDEISVYYVDIVNKNWGNKKVKDFTPEEKTWFYMGMTKYSNELRRQLDENKDEEWKKILNAYIVVLYATINGTRLNEQAIKLLEYTFDRRYEKSGKWHDLSGNYTAWGRIGRGILMGMGITIGTYEDESFKK